MQLRRILPFVLALCAFTADAQSGEEPYTLYIKKAKAPIQLDGELNEADWQDAQVATDFFQNFPQDTAFAALQTEVRMTFDGDFLYVGALIRQKRADYIITSLKRDFDRGATDVFTVNIDPFSDKINGFHFAVSPYNVQREGIIDNGENINTDWDNKWYSKVRNYDDHWTVEMAIPFKTLRYKATDGRNVWRVGFARNSVKQNELSSWVPVPRQFSPNNLAFAGQLVWEERPPAPGLNVSIIPYLAAGTAQDFEFKLPAEGRFNAGADVKIAVTPSLNLDLTFNPDFSQVEVDRQLTNLSRFELFFPERRQFFLENEDLFSRFGFPNSRPFFSRRIGLARGTIQRTTTDGQVISVERSLRCAHPRRRAPQRKIGQQLARRAAQYAIGTGGGPRPATCELLRRRVAAPGIRPLLCGRYCGEQREFYAQSRRRLRVGQECLQPHRRAGIQPLFKRQ
jgi:hypothetical protein